MCGRTLKKMSQKLSAKMLNSKTPINTNTKTGSCDVNKVYSLPKAPLLLTLPEDPSTVPTVEHFERLIKQTRRRCIRKYYKSQIEILNDYAEDRLLLKQFAELKCRVAAKRTTVADKVIDSDKHRRLCDQIISCVTLILNGFLLIMKCAAAIMSGSMAIVSSVIDSAVDMTSGVVLSLTTRAIRKRDPYLYPRGRTRLDPLATIIVSVIMGVASVYVISKSLEKIIQDDISIDVSTYTIGIMVFTILTKFGLFVLCRCFRSSATDTLAQDHRNDCISNTVAITCAFIADKFPIFRHLDPIGAILVSFYILGTWYTTGCRFVRMLTGRAAPPEFYSRIIRVAVDHDPGLVRLIDTVQVYHLGAEFLVEVHVVLDRDMPVHQAHDISEELQRKIEHLPKVERAFVHVDYEATHRPDLEHKIV